ncbi:caspase family protein [Neolewinella persica]|uniref:caspase family protein n=1 Tax=Neolewinella persica TaxID=70998 RepID=UPI00036E84C2|nr:caspase family protein [Neolewinella persica]
MTSLSGHTRSRQITAAFLTALRAEGYPIGVEQYQAVQELLDRLPSTTSESVLGDSLVALFAMDANGQERFRRIFHNACEQADATEKPVEKKEDEFTRANRRDRHKLLQRFAGLLLVLFLPLVAYFIWPAQEFPTTERTIIVTAGKRNFISNVDSLATIGRVLTFGLPAYGTVDAPKIGRVDTAGLRLYYEANFDTIKQEDAFIVRLEGTNKRFTHINFRVVVEQKQDTARAPVLPVVQRKDTPDYTSFDPLPHPRTLLDLAVPESQSLGYADFLYFAWWPLILFGYLILLGVFYFYLRNQRRKNIRLVAQREQFDGAPHFWPIELPEFRAGIDWGENYPALLRQLRRRREDDHRELDLGKTIKQTINQGGLPSFHYRLATRPAEYLLLIDRGANNNHHARLFDQLYRQLAAEEVYIERYFFDGDPRLLFQDNRGRSTSLINLQRRFPNSRLLLVGSGDRLLNPASGKLTKWANDQFSLWANRSLLTTRPPNEWGIEERRLSQFFAVLPASMQGLRLLAERTNDGHSPEDPVDYRALIDDAEREPILFSNSLIGSLLDHFSLAQTQWIAACALYPTLHWDLSLFFGHKVGEFTNENLLSSRNILSLSRLPWFTGGTIPVTARDELIRWLEQTAPGLHRKLRLALLAALEQNAPPPEGSVAKRELDFFHLQNEWLLAFDDPDKRKNLSKKLARDIATGNDPDITVARFLNHEPPAGTLPLSLPQSWNKRLYPEGYRALGLKPETWQLLWALPLFILVMLVGWWWQPDKQSNERCDSTIWPVVYEGLGRPDTILNIQICSKTDSLTLAEYRWQDRIGRATRIEDLDTLTILDLSPVPKTSDGNAALNQGAIKLQEFLDWEAQDSLDVTHRKNIGALLWNRGLQLKRESQGVCNFFQTASELMIVSGKKALILETCTPIGAIRSEEQSGSEIDSTLAEDSEQITNEENSTIDVDSVVDERVIRTDQAESFLPSRTEDNERVATEVPPLATREILYLPEVSDLRVYKDTFEMQTLALQQWLSTTGIGKILRVRELDVEEKGLSVYLEFITNDLALQVASWRILNEYYETKLKEDVENTLLEQTSRYMRVRKDLLNVQLYNTYDLRKQPLFSRTIYYENSEVKIQESNPISPIQVKAEVLDSLRNVFQKSIEIKRSNRPGDVAEEITVGNNYALLVGVSEYTTMPNLANPVKDTRNLAQELENSYSFYVNSVENPTRTELLAQLEEFKRRNFKKNDQLLIYFSGHGYRNRNKNSAGIALADFKGVGTLTGINILDLVKIVDQISCNKILLIIDADYAGLNLGDKRSDLSIDEVNNDENLTRVYIAASSNEPVPDKSPMLVRIMESLKSTTLENRFLTVNQLFSDFSSVRPQPVKEYFGRHETGNQFVFVKTK